MIQIPKLKFGDEDSISAVRELARKMKLVRRDWQTKSIQPAHSEPFCQACDQRIARDSVAAFDIHGGAIHRDCLDQLRDLATRTGGGLR